MGIFCDLGIGCGTCWLVKRLVAHDDRKGQGRREQQGQGEAVPCVPQRFRRVRVQVQVHRLSALLLLLALQRPVAAGRQRRRGRAGPLHGRPSCHFPTAIAHQWSPRWRPLRQARGRAASPPRGSCASNAMRRAAWRSCVRSCATRSTISRSSTWVVLKKCQTNFMRERARAREGGGGERAREKLFPDKRTHLQLRRTLIKTNKQTNK